jgi:hypothetical protein
MSAPRIYGAKRPPHRRIRRFVGGSCILSARVSATGRGDGASASGCGTNKHNSIGSGGLQRGSRSRMNSCTGGGIRRHLKDQQQQQMPQFAQITRIMKRNPVSNLLWGDPEEINCTGGILKPDVVARANSTWSPGSSLRDSTLRSMTRL